jgi:hypothetical protein
MLRLVSDELEEVEHDVASKEWTLRLYHELAYMELRTKYCLRGENSSFE